MTCTWPKKWRENGLHWLQHRTVDFECKNLKGKALRIKIVSRIAPPVFDKAFECEYVYTIHGNGEIALDCSVSAKGEWCDTLPRVGLVTRLPKKLDQVKWFGLGPGECYVDSKEAQRVGVHTKTVEQLSFPYIYPQETGNRTETRWVAMTNLEGAGLLAIGRPLIDFSAHWHTQEDLAEAKHQRELVRRDFVSLHLDHAPVRAWQQQLRSRALGEIQAQASGVPLRP